MLIAPIIPGLSDAAAQLEEVTAACLAAGAVSVTALPLHLRPGVKEHFLSDLRAKRPELAEALARRYRGAYLPRRQQDDIVGPVTRTVARLRPVTPPPRQWHPAQGPADERSRARATPPAEPGTEQLTFGT